MADDEYEDLIDVGSERGALLAARVRAHPVTRAVAVLAALGVLVAVIVTRRDDGGSRRAAPSPSSSAVATPTVPSASASPVVDDSYLYAVPPEDLRAELRTPRLPHRVRHGHPRRLAAAAGDDVVPRDLPADRGPHQPPGRGDLPEHRGAGRAGRAGPSRAAADRVVRGDQAGRVGARRRSVPHGDRPAGPGRVAAHGPARGAGERAAVGRGAGLERDDPPADVRCVVLCSAQRG